MVLIDPIKELKKYGLAQSEAYMYCYLLNVKSASVSDLIKTEEFKEIKRPNLYKIIHKLEEKNFIISEQKGKKKVYFPLEPANILKYFIDKQQKMLDSLKETIPEVITQLTSLLETPNSEFFSKLSYLPIDVQIFCQKTVGSNWLIKEMPDESSIKGLGDIFSIEYDTRHKFSANSAGIVFHRFKFKEHRDEAFDSILNYLTSNMKNALENVGKHIPIRFKNIIFESKLIEITIRKKINKFEYIEINIDTNILGTFKGGMITLKIEDFPNDAVCLWAAKLSDFKKMIHNLTNSFTINFNETK